VYNLQAIIGNEFLNEFMEKTDIYKNGDSGKQGELKSEAFCSWTTYVYLKNCDNNKYGSLKKNLQLQYALRNNQYPKTISTTTDVLTNHQWDDKYRVTDKKKKEQSTGGNRSMGNEKEEKLLVQAGKKTGKELAKVQCFCCGEMGHYSDNCKRKETLEKDKWYIKTKVIPDGNEKNR
jgi:hypothetical protein